MLSVCLHESISGGAEGLLIRVDVFNLVLEGQLRILSCIVCSQDPEDCQVAKQQHPNDWLLVLG